MDGDLLALCRLGAGAGSQDLLLEAHPSLLRRLSPELDGSLWEAAAVLRIASLRGTVVGRCLIATSGCEGHSFVFIRSAFFSQPSDGYYFSEKVD